MCRLQRRERNGIAPSPSLAPLLHFPRPTKDPVHRLTCIVLCGLYEAFSRCEREPSTHPLSLLSLISLRGSRLDPTIQTGQIL